MREEARRVAKYSGMAAWADEWEATVAASVCRGLEPAVGGLQEDGSWRNVW